MALHFGDRSRPLTDDEYRESRRRNASKQRAIPHPRMDRPRFNAELGDVMRPEPAPQEAELLPLERRTW